MSRSVELTFVTVSSEAVVVPVLSGPVVSVWTLSSCSSSSSICLANRAIISDNEYPSIMTCVNLEEVVVVDLVVVDVA